MLDFDITKTKEPIASGGGVGAVSLRSPASEIHYWV